MLLKGDPGAGGVCEAEIKLPSLVCPPVRAGSAAATRGHCGRGGRSLRPDPHLINPGFLARRPERGTHLHRPRNPGPQLPFPLDSGVCTPSLLFPGARSLHPQPLSRIQESAPRGSLSDWSPESQVLRDSDRWPPCPIVAKNYLWTQTQISKF